MQSDQSGPNGLLPLERRAAVSLSLIYGVRMLGLFIILPVFTVLAADYEGSTPVLIGLGLGIYGLCQAVLQIPFGMMSDRLGRKPVILAGLLLFVVGSIVAALADSIVGLVIGRALQGAGAISAALIALAADLTRDEQRTKIMATLGGSIGLAFVLALILGPLLVSWWSLSVLFWFTAFSGVAAMVVVLVMVPTPSTHKISGDTVAQWRQFGRLLRDGQLLRLDFSIFLLHLIVTATFVGVPLALQAQGHPLNEHWYWYLPALLMSLAVMVPLVIVAEKHRRIRAVFLLAVLGIGIAQLVLFKGHISAGLIFIGLLVFFCFFNTLEALLPSLVSKLAPPGARGSAMGIYSTGQFLGAFAGGVGGGWLYATAGLTGLFLCLALSTALWFVLVFGLTNPRPVSSYLWPTGEISVHQGHALAERLREVSGVHDAVVVASERIAYLKIDKRHFAPESLQTISAEN
ncbi:MAG: MFS transporter [Gammaproteobacteria bacterium]|nr:MFS transporter [Gammaproteobacteria bacterium]